MSNTAEIKTVTNQISLETRFEKLMRLIMPSYKLTPLTIALKARGSMVMEINEYIENCLEEDVVSFVLMSDSEFESLYERLQRQWPRYLEYLREEEAEYNREFS